MDATIKTISDRLHPNPYPTAVHDLDGVPLLLIRPSWFGAKYGLAVVAYNSEAATAQVGRIRRVVDSFTDSSFLSGCGLIILFIAPEADWPAGDAIPKPDQHGLRSTIVQGFIWLDPATGKHQMSRSSWGPIKFGNLQGQVTAIRAMLHDWPHPADRS